MRRSIAMLEPGTKAQLTRKEAMRLISELQEVERRMRDLRRAMQAVLNDEPNYGLESRRDRRASMEEVPMEAKGHIDIAFSGRASLSLWHWYSIYHAVAAAHFARQAHDIEEQPPPPSSDERSRGMRTTKQAFGNTVPA